MPKDYDFSAFDDVAKQLPEKPKDAKEDSKYDFSAFDSAAKALEGPSALESLLRGTVNIAGLAPVIAGGAEALFTSKPYEQAREESHKAFEAAREAHPWAYGGGQVLGGLATAPLLPELAGLGGAVKLAAGLGATTGLGESLSAGQYDPSQVAKNIAMGGVLGAVTGGAAHGLAKGAEKLVKSLSPQALEEAAAERAIKTGGATAGQRGSLLAKDRYYEHGNKMLEPSPYTEGKPLVELGSTAEDIYYAGRDAILPSGKDVGKALKTFDDIGKIIPEARDTLDRKSTRLNSSHMSESRMPSSA